MNNIKNINKTYVIAAVLSNHFFVTKYLLYNLYTAANNYTFMYIVSICTFILLLSPLLYWFTKKNYTAKKSPLTMAVLSIYLLFSSVLSLVTASNFISIHWLNMTNQTLIIGSLLALIIYVCFIDTKALYKTYSLLFLILIGILLIYVGSKYQFLSFHQMTMYISLSKFNLDVLIYSSFIVLETFFIFFIPAVQKTALTKKSFYSYILFMIVIILFEGVIELNEFNGIIQYVTYPFFESFNIIYFGQYIGYLNFPVLFVYVIGCFSKVSLNIKVMQENFGKSKWLGLYIVLCFAISIALLKNADDYAQIRVFFVLPALISLLAALILYNYKGGLSHERHSNTATTLPEK